MESRFSLCALVALLSWATVSVGSAEEKKALPAESLYQVEAKLVNQEGKEITLGSLRGHPVVVTMVYTRCTYTCPMVVKKMKDIESALKKNPGLRLLLVSFDHERESPESMKKFMRERDLDPSRWVMAKGKSSGAVREIASLLDINYKKEASGDYSHSNVVALLDKEGVKKVSVTGIAADHSDLVTAARRDL